nr:hypothetical protein [Tanacetum cinerariifolium]
MNQNRHRLVAIDGTWARVIPYDVCGGLREHQPVGSSLWAAAENKNGSAWSCKCCNAWFWYGERLKGYYKDQKMIPSVVVKDVNRDVKLLQALSDHGNFENEKALRNGEMYNWETATYGKIRYVEYVHYLKFFETEFPTIVFDDALTSELEFSSEPTLIRVKDLSNHKCREQGYGRAFVVLLPFLEYWLRIEQYFQVQDYALWDVIENENSFILADQTTTNADGTSTTLIPSPVTTEEKVQKKNDLKARSMLLMALSNEHLMTFNQYKDAKTLFAAIQIRFGGNEATKKTQKTLLKQMYENFSAPSTYTNEVNTAYRVSTANTQVSLASTASTQVSTANLSDATVYAFLASQPNGSQLVHEDLVQIYKDNLEEMDLKWQLALLSMRTRKFFQKTSRKITINWSDTARYDKSKSYMADDEVHTNMALMDFSDFELDLSNSGLEEFQQHKFEGYGPKTSNSVNEYISNEVKESPNAPLVKNPKAFNTARPNSAIVNVVRENQGNLQLKLQEKGVIDSGCSRHMTRNMFYLSEYEEIDGGYVAFGGDPKEVKSPIKVKSVQEAWAYKFQNYEQTSKGKSCKRIPSLSFMRPFGCHVTILNTLDPLGSGQTWLFDIDTLTKSMNCKPVVAGNQSNGSVGKARVKTVPDKDYILLPLWTQDLLFVFGSKNSPGAGCKPSGEEEKKDAEVYGCADDPNMPNLEEIVYSDDDEEVSADADMTNLDTNIPISPIPTTRIHKDHQVKQIIRDIHSAPQTKRMTKNVTNLGMQVWTLVDLPNGKKAIGTKWIYKNKKDERGIVIKNKVRLVAQGYPQEEGIDYDDAFAPVVRIEAIRLFLAYASFKDFVVYQMYVKSAFLQDKYVDEILKKFDFSTVKTASTPMETSKPLLKDENAKDVDVHLYRSMIGSLMYLTSSRPDIMFAVCACARFQVTPKVSHLLAVKRIFRYLKGQPKLGLRYPKDSPFNLEAYTDSDYAGLNTINEEEQIQALVDKKKAIITSTSIRSDLQLEDDEAPECLPNAIIFEQLTLMCAKATAWNEFSSTMASAIICLATNQKFNFSKYIFDNMVKNLEAGVTFLMFPRQGKDFSERVTPVFPTMLRKQKIKKPRRKDTELPQTSVPTEVIADEAVYKEMYDNVERATTTATGLDVVDPGAKISRGMLLLRLGRNDQVMFDTGVLDDEEVAVKEVSTADPVTTAGEVVTTGGVKVSATATTPTISMDDITLAKALAALKSAKPMDKGKAKIIETEKPLKKKDQIMNDEKVTRNLKAQLQAELKEKERLARQKEEEANIALIAEWDDV